MKQDKHETEEMLDELRNEVSSHENPRLKEENRMKMKMLFG